MSPTRTRVRRDTVTVGELLPTLEIEDDDYVVLIQLGKEEKAADAQVNRIWIRSRSIWLFCKSDEDAS